MKLCMFNENRLGLIEETKVYDISPILEQLPKQTYPFPTYDLLIASLDSLKAQILKAKEDAVIYQIENINLLSPVLNPGKIIAAPVNYQAHFDEAAAEPKCEVVKNFKLLSYKCDVSKNAFGADKDAILLENQDQRIFVYSDSKDCNEMLEMRNSNAP